MLGLYSYIQLPALPIIEGLAVSTTALTVVVSPLVTQSSFLKNPDIKFDRKEVAAFFVNGIASATALGEELYLDFFGFSLFSFV